LAPLLISRFPLSQRFGLFPNFFFLHLGADHGIEQLAVFVKHERGDPFDFKRSDKSPVRTGIENIKIDDPFVFLLCKRLNLSRENLAGLSPGPPNFYDRGKAAPQNLGFEITSIEFFHKPPLLSYSFKWN
jgi:hypothetical protein